MQNDKLKFTYELRESGAANATFAYNEIVISFHLTNVSNPLNELLEGIASIIRNPSQLWGERNVKVVSWYCGATTYNWNLEMLNNSTLRLRISQGAGFFDDTEEIDLINADLNLHIFINVIISELDSFIKRTGILNYAQLWQKGYFPITDFLFLKKHLIDFNIWTCRTNEPCDTLSDEILLLMA